MEYKIVESLDLQYTDLLKSTSRLSRLRNKLEILMHRCKMHI